MKRLTLAILAAVLLVAPAAGSAAPSRECGSQKARTCNPQQECLKQVEGSLKGPALDKARKDCGRMPTTGTCYSGDIQSDCQEPKKKSKS
jgi:hypothetical protein